jgi:hypothetical protein
MVNDLVSFFNVIISCTIGVFVVVLGLLGILYYITNVKNSILEDKEDENEQPKLDE